MRTLTCPHCGEAIEVFPAADEARSIWAEGVRRLGSIPLAPSLALAGDRGVPVLIAAAWPRFFPELARIGRLEDLRPVRPRA